MNLGLVCVAGALVLIGQWGRRKAPSLVSARTRAAGHGPDQERMLRRGAMACHLAAAVLVAFWFRSLF